MLGEWIDDELQRQKYFPVYSDGDALAVQAGA
jgi:hypothetical protein